MIFWSPKFREIQVNNSRVRYSVKCFIQLFLVYINIEEEEEEVELNYMTTTKWLCSIRWQT
jgi:hypothetical protein